MKSLSQAGQDLFVYNILDKKNNGTYLDIGCGDCTCIFDGMSNGSNTLLLSQLGWNGIGFDIDNSHKWGWDHIRKHKIIVDDITSLDWNNLITHNAILQDTIDYLSFDIDDATSDGIRAFPFDKIRFRVITIEHDSYRVGDSVKNEIRNVLSNNGYELLCSDVMVQITGYYPWIFEDWWVDMSKVDRSLAEKFRCDKELGHNIHLKANTYLSQSLKIDISPGEGLDRLSILNIKREYINNEKLKDIQHELSIFKPLINDILTKNLNLYTKLYKVNKIIWELSNIIRTKEDNTSYNNALVEIHTYNDERFKLKAQINNACNSKLKEHKSYNNIDSELTIKNHDILYYVSSGLLGDFINGLYIIKKNYELTNKKGVLRISNFKNLEFRFPLVETYYELIPIISSQVYIEDFIIDDSANSIEDIIANNPEIYINLSEWYKSPDLYKTHWLNIFTNYYSLQYISSTVKWLEYSNYSDKFKDFILIHNNKGELNEFTLNILSKNNCVFITCNINEYNNSPYKNMVSSYYICEDLFELFTAINSCKFFIGSQSSPLAIAYALGKRCLGELIGGDMFHYAGMEKYNEDFFWVSNNNILSGNINTLNKYLVI
jgi:hypothetical protein